MNFILLIVIFGISVMREEKNLKRETFYLKIAPRDPRSIMQGDYMALNYELGNNMLQELRVSETLEPFQNREGYVRVKTDEKNVAHFLGVEKTYREPLENERSLEFHRGEFTIDFGINSYFFQEGTGEKFQAAEFAEVIPLKNGKLRLKSLRDRDFQKIK